MNKAYHITILLAALAIFAFGVVLISADDADATDFGVKLTYTDHPVYYKMARGMNPITFNFTIKNTGTYPAEDVEVQLRNPPSNWNIVYSATTSTDVYLGTYSPDDPFEVTLQRDETADMIVTVTPAPKQLNQTYEFFMNVYPDKAQGQNESAQFGVVIPQVAGFQIKLWGPKENGELPPNNNFHAAPGSTVTLEFAVYNRGNGKDQFLIQGTSSRELAGWTLTFTKGVDRYGYTPNLTANTPENSPHIVEIKIPIPADERAGLKSQITLNATSLFNMSLQMQPAFASVSSDQYPLFEVYINGKDKKEGIPGKEVEFQLRIQNTGNGWDTFNITPLWDSDLNPGFIASSNPRSIDIDARENGTIQYIVKVPASAPKKTYFFTAEVRSSFKQLAPLTRSFAVEVGQYYALEIRAEDNYRRTIPGESLEFDVVVTNKGNGLDSIVIDKITDAPASWITYYQPPEVTLLQDQEAVIKIIVIVPSHFEEAPIGFYNLTQSARSSRADPTVEAETYLEIEITQFYRIEWMYQGVEVTNPERPIAPAGSIRPRRSFNPYEKDNIDITLEIKNLGNGGDNITMAGYSPDDRITVQLTPGYTFLPRDQVKYIKVSITVPKDLPPGVYNLFANATSQDPDFPERVVPLDFEIENYDAKVDPFPTFIDETVGEVVRSELSADAGANLSFKLKVENNGTRPLSGVTIRVWDNYNDGNEPVSWNFFNFTTPPIAVGDKFVVGDVSPNSDYPPLYWVASHPGQHELMFKVFYNSQSEDDNDVSTVVVLVNEKSEEGLILTESTAFLGAVIAILVAVIIVVGYVFAIRRKPQVDADLYSSIYGADFEEGDVTADVEVPAEEAGATLTPEQQALYGEDYGTAEGEEYDYDEYDEEYDYEYDEEYAEGEYDEEYAEGEYDEEYDEEYAEGEYDEEYAEGEYDEATDAAYEEEDSPEKPTE